MSALGGAIRALCLAMGVMASLALIPAQADSVPFWGAKASVPIDTPINQLKKGEFLWMGEAVTTGPVVMVVSITEQRGYVYRNGILIGASTVSTGRPGHLTPTGVFTVLQKQKEHRSTIYDGAPMPYMERLTWGGIALHLAPVQFAGGKPVEPETFAATEDERWQPELSTTGPVSIVLSQASQLIVVYRNGIEIGRARLTVTGDTPLVNHALVLTEAPSSVPDPYVPDPSKFSWLRIGVAGHIGEQGTQVDPNAVARIKMPANFAAQVNGILTPGATLLVTNEALYPQTSGPMVQVVDADPPAKR